MDVSASRAGVQGLGVGPGGSWKEDARGRLVRGRGRSGKSAVKTGRADPPGAQGLRFGPEVLCSLAGEARGRGSSGKLPKT